LSFDADTERKGRTTREYFEVGALDVDLQSVARDAAIPLQLVERDHVQCDLANDLVTVVCPHPGQQDARATRFARQPEGRASWMCADEPSLDRHFAEALDPHEVARLDRIRLAQDESQDLTEGICTHGWAATSADVIETEWRVAQSRKLRMCAECRYGASKGGAESLVLNATSNDASVVSRATPRVSCIQLLRKPSRETTEPGTT
jgi:hypothetical protein